MQRWGSVRAFLGSTDAGTTDEGESERSGGSTTAETSGGSTTAETSGGDSAAGGSGLFVANSAGGTVCLLPPLSRDALLWRLEPTALMLLLIAEPRMARGLHREGDVEADVEAEVEVEVEKDAKADAEVEVEVEGTCETRGARGQQAKGSATGSSAQGSASGGDECRDFGELADLVYSRWERSRTVWLQRRWRMQQEFESNDDLLGLYSDTEE